MRINSGIDLFFSFSVFFDKQQLVTAMILLSLLLFAFVGLGGSKNFLEVPLQIDKVPQPIFPVSVGTRFEFNGVYQRSLQTGSQSKNIANAALYDDEGNRVFSLQLRFNYSEEPLEGDYDYVIVTSKYKETWASKGDYSKKYKFPMDLEDELQIDILVEVTKSHYEVTINGVKSTQSMINSRENVEYYKTKTLQVRSSASFTFKTAIHMIKIGESSL